MDEFSAPNALSFSRSQWRRPDQRAAQEAGSWRREDAPAIAASGAGAGGTGLGGSRAGAAGSTTGNPRLRAASGADEVAPAPTWYEVPVATTPPRRPSARRPAATTWHGGTAAAARAGRGLAASLRLVPMVAALGLAALILAGAMGLAALVGGGEASDQSGTLLGQSGAAPTGDTTPSAPDADTPPTSTPRSQWARGAVPFLYQIDEEWADAPYAGASVAESGCGPTCLSMVYVALTGKTDRDPAAMAAFSEQGGYVESGMTAWRLMSDGARTIGLRSRELSASADAIRAELRAGRPVICSVGPGDFTTKGHFIVLSGVNENGDVIVHDPNSEQRSLQPWDPDRIISQCLNLWSFERA